MLSTWIKGLAGTAAFTALALAATPPGRVKTVLRFLCGVVTAMALLGPLASLDLDSSSESLAAYRERLTAAADTKAGDRLARDIIEKEAAAYIWDKAAEHGLTPDTVTVTARWGGSFWVPDTVTVTGVAEAERAALAKIAEAALGIPPAKQFWGDSHEGKTAQDG